MLALDISLPQRLKSTRLASKAAAWSVIGFPRARPMNAGMYFYLEDIVGGDGGDDEVDGVLNWLRHRRKITVG